MNRGLGFPKISIPMYSFIKFSLYLCHGLLLSYPIFQKKPLSFFDKGQAEAYAEQTTAASAKRPSCMKRVLGSMFSPDILKAFT